MKRSALPRDVIKLADELGYDVTHTHKGRIKFLHRSKGSTVIASACVTVRDERNVIADLRRGARP